MAKAPTAKEILTDPKYTEQKGFLKELISGLAEEMQAESKKKPAKKSEVNLFDSLFGGSSEDDNDE
jgi:hypothetical protein